MDQLANPTADFRAEEKERLIRSSFLFRDLDGDMVCRLARLSRTRRIAKGALLFQQGDEGDALYGVVQGLIRISVAGRGGKEFTLGLVEPGDVFGEIALLDGLPRTASAEAVEDTVLLMIGRAVFLDLLEQERPLARHIIELLCERLRLNTDHLSEQAFLGLRARLARKLKALAIGYGQDGEDGVRIALKLSQTDLAQMLGVTREAINKQLKAWSQDGILRIDHGYIILCNPNGLTIAASADED